MRRGYRLREREQGTVDGQPASLANPHCRRLTGTRRWLAQTSLPATIELWTDVSTGMARRIELRWQPGTDPRNRERVLVEWIGEEPLPDDWFEAEGFRPPRFGKKPGRTDTGPGHASP
jgi:hypothetical protein